MSGTTWNTGGRPPASMQGVAVVKAGGPAVRQLRTADLFGPAREIELVHADGVYRLRITRNNKLILTK